ncbi:MAG: hypothetical protein Q7T54_01460 [Candidatus Levybacteria bacterium]|nr:hypothetical protein [Candidatus Levybacteria bacterium]
MAIEAIYYRPDQDFEVVKKEPVEVGSVFSHIHEGKTPDGHYVQGHVVKVTDDDEIFGFSSFQYDGKNRHEEAKYLRAGEINGSGYSFMRTMDPNVSLQLKYTPEQPSSLQE